MVSVKHDPNERDAGVVDEIVGYVTSTPPRSFFLFAGAGSGKTRTLVAVLRKITGIGTVDAQEEPGLTANDAAVRFARELRARAQTILVITYTKNAALVVTGRLGSNDLTQVTTIHSFCWDLIAGFDEDIREALLAMNANALQKANDAAARRKKGPTDKDKEKIGELEAKAAALAATPQFTYSPDRKRHGDGALNHSQVLALASWLLKQKPTLRRILRDQHPVILIDESQDTMKSILDSLLEVVAEAPSRLMLGLLGDHRQRIYLDGHADLPSLVPEAWATPRLEMNHRSQRRIVDLINEIWDSDLEGRTQSRKAVHQYPREEKSEGLVRIFIGNASASAEDKLHREALCEAAMKIQTGFADWEPGSLGHKVLALEHSLVARRGDFLEAFEALSLLDPDSVHPDANGDISGPTAVQMLLREMMDLADCIKDGGVPSDFAVTEVLHRYGRLQQLPEDVESRMKLLKAYQQAVEDFVMACVKPAVTVREVLAPVLQVGLFEPDKRLVAAFNDMNPPPPAPKPRQPETLENRFARGWHGLFESPWIQLRRFKTYLSGKSHLATHQVVKGLEFDHVMVVMDDEDAAGNHFAYDRLFGAPLGDSDVKNVAEGKETSIDRTLRLLYVTCSRARESLALVLWAKDSAQALAYAQKSKWFKPGEVQAIPE
ncbi:UvrD-helicase domain-containing protein [Chromobacterium sp. IIBBL 290-4]|uniref:UvrD-helicase domain-containing protein n=1 Tax=Chromobacterium sp. IIBBL 290-4 TaxID=2953890 RepID=UPI0020B87C2D|nr:UvrD-helicase domain-containing protein [Chromobacterium sp. IIBBL 290-4]UTH74433.1 UvrD-helicase domain-containing protein [Chromobacterium sp. IIBBL 290-4]